MEEQRDVDVATPLTTSISGVRLSAQHAFNPNFNILPNRWVAGGFVQLQNTDRSGSGTMSTFEDQSYGAFVRAFVYEDIYVETAWAQVMQDNVISGVAGSSDESILSVQLGWEF